MRNPRELLGYEQAERAQQANLPPRFHRLDCLERYVVGTQYESRPSFWDDSVPMAERAPCVVYPVVESAIRSVVDFCLGEGRWPSITACSVEAEEEPEEKPDGEDEAPALPKPKKRVSAKPFDDRFSLTEEEAEVVDAFLEAVVDQAKLKRAASELLESGMGCKTAVAIGCVRDGKLCIETTKAKWCTVKRNPKRPSEVESLEIRYPYLREYFDTRERKWAVECLLYRRVIDANSDTTFKPARASEDGEEPDTWTVDKDKSIDHKLGFCPVVWYAHRKRCATVAEEDGTAIHENLLDEIDGLNMALSLRHRAAMYASDPQIVEIGVEKGYNPAPSGRQPEVVLGGGTDPVTGNRTPSYVIPAKNGKAARMRGVGVVWTYERGENVDVKMLTLPGDALKSADDNVRDLRSKVAEALGVVFVDPDNAKFSAELSGKALARLYDRQIRLCDKEREDFGDECLLAIVDMLLRIALSVGKRKDEALYLAGLTEVLPILERFQANVVGGKQRWFSPQLDLAWGPYFEPSETDAKALVEYVSAAHTAGLITKYTAVEELGDVFAIGNVDGYLDELEQEDEADAAKQTEQKVGEAEAMAEVMPPKPMPGKPVVAKAVPVVAS